MTASWVQNGHSQANNFPILSSSQADIESMIDGNWASSWSATLLPYGIPEKSSYTVWADMRVPSCDTGFASANFGIVLRLAFRQESVICWWNCSRLSPGYMGSRSILLHRERQRQSVVREVGRFVQDRATCFAVDPAVVHEEMIYVCEEGETVHYQH
ncbi:hypothetical protein CAPTEDRAFT_202433 [Capitella teleta]|uniref:Uncharacterized protein n=1 Tax=Capitella teleta TaxID=283909 RepID=R7U7Y0_CAPTE|nr:hypothetical protein CAPTEDRAFT_202433 [Capitella teleta]|eukprot:ELT99230.1 hypothetical protein CAPTEDRAFT_202433 [Capitella teleta]